MPEDVPLMFEQGNVDMLAVSVGSEHGHASRLDLDLLKAIAAKANGPLVLHGGSGIHEDDARAALKYGRGQDQHRQRAVGGVVHRLARGAGRPAATTTAC